MHKDKLYQQRDGVSMGSPLAPTLENFLVNAISVYHAKINEALLMKKHAPVPNSIVNFKPMGHLFCFKYFKSVAA